MVMAVDAFAGPGGWSEACRVLGITEVGVELNADACRTRAAAGHLTVRADVATYPAERFHGYQLFIASPPCPTFSKAGKRSGIADMGRLHAHIEHCARHGWTAPGGGWGDPRTPLVLEVLRWVEAVQPTAIALEQVPDVLPVWEQIAAVLQEWGYRGAWAGLLSAERYGVPQTRERAILMAHRHRPVSPPEPTHQEYRSGEPQWAEPLAHMFGHLDPWVSMADALGWGYDDSPARVVCGKRSPRWLYQDHDGTHGRTLTEPAPTLLGNIGKNGGWGWELHTACGFDGVEVTSAPGHHDADMPNSQHGEGSMKLTVEQALVLQSFRPDYPVSGTKTSKFQQVGNAIPPRLAQAILEQLL